MPLKDFFLLNRLFQTFSDALYRFKVGVKRLVPLPLHKRKKESSQKLVEFFLQYSL